MNLPLQNIAKSASQNVLKEYESFDNHISYYEFFKQAFEVLEPGTKFVDNWHVRYLCDLYQAEVERIARGEDKTGDLIINIMPRSLKSLIFTVMPNAWVWTRYPHFKFITISFAEPLSTEHSEKTLRLIRSDWYQYTFGDSFEILKSTKGKKHFANSKGGERKATSVGGQVTGSGADILTIDDPIKPPTQGEITFNETELRQANHWYDSTAYNRINDPSVSLRILIMQRLHNNDLTQHCLNKKSGKYRHVCIPGELTEDIKPKYLKKFYMPDKLSGDKLFFPQRFSKDVLEDYEENMGDNYDGQVLQRPDKKGGGDWKEEYFKKITLEELPSVSDARLCAWDLALTKEQRKDRSASAFVKGFRYKGAGYVTDFGWAFKKFTELYPWIMSVSSGDKNSIEKKSAGEGIIATLIEEGIDVLNGENGYTKGNRDKFQEASLATKKAKKHQIYILDTIYDKFLHSQEQGICKFPTASWDDVHDAFCNWIINIFDGVISGEDIRIMSDANKRLKSRPSISTYGDAQRGMNIRRSAI